MNVDHEGVEVDATFGGDIGRKCAVEEVHEHGLAGTDRVIQVETLRSGGGRV